MTDWENFYVIVGSSGAALLRSSMRMVLAGRALSNPVSL